MTKEDMDKFRVLASEERFRAGLRWLADFRHASWDQVRDFISSFVLPDDEFEVYLRLIDAYEKEKKNPGDTELGNKLRFEMARKWNTLDPLSIVGASVPPTDQGDSFPWNMLSPAYFLAPFNADKVSGGFLTITGRPRAGKTGCACLLCELWLVQYPATEVLTNIPLVKPVPGIRPVEDMVGLLRGIADALTAERRWLWAFDEPALSGWMKADAPSGRSKNLERFARIVPKLGGSFIYIEQRVEGVPTVIQDFAQSHILCVSPGFALADLPAHRTTIRGIPHPSTVKYRTGEAGYFEVPADFPFDRLFRVLRYDPSILQIADLPASTQGQRILRFLEELEPKEKGEKKPSVRCVHCGHEWIPKKDEPPVRCPRCDRRNPLGLVQEPASASEEDLPAAEEDVPREDPVLR